MKAEICHYVDMDITQYTQMLGAKLRTEHYFAFPRPPHTRNKSIEKIAETSMEQGQKAEQNKNKLLIRVYLTRTTPQAPQERCGKPYNNPYRKSRMSLLPHPDMVLLLSWLMLVLLLLLV